MGPYITCVRLLSLTHELVTQITPMTRPCSLQIMDGELMSHKATDPPLFLTILRA